VARWLPTSPAAPVTTIFIGYESKSTSKWHQEVYGGGHAGNEQEYSLMDRVADREIFVAV
jgi:hypothetical protein